MHAITILRALSWIRDELLMLVESDWRWLSDDLNHLAYMIAVEEDSQRCDSFVVEIFRNIQRYPKASGLLGRIYQNILEEERRALPFLAEEERGELGFLARDLANFFKYNSRRDFQYSYAAPPEPDQPPVPKSPPLYEPMPDASPEPPEQIEPPLSRRNTGDLYETIPDASPDLPAHEGWVDDSSDAITSERQINAWIVEAFGYPDKLLVVGESYTLVFNVGAALLHSLISGPEAVIAESDVPDEGLTTRWVIISNTVEIISITADVQAAEEAPVDGKRVWTASFDLMIPKLGASDIRKMKIIPRVKDVACLEVRIFSSKELYRSLSITLIVTAPQESQTDFAESPLLIRRDVPLSPAAHLNMRTPHEWMTPPSVVNVSVIPGMGKAYLNGSVVSAGRFESVHQTADWRAQSAAVAGPMRNARDALEKFRSKHENYLNFIEPDDLRRRLLILRSLPLYARPYDWGNPGNDADQTRNRLWDEVSVSDELRKLAYEGHVLYESFFPRGTELRQYIDSMLPGHRINITWQQGMGGDWLAHIPWGLMYLPDPPYPGSPVDAMGFWGMRFRTEYYAHEVKNVTRDLGRLEEARKLYFLYWGGQPQDVTAIEARWQKEEFAAWPNQDFVPSTQMAAKAELLEALGYPSPPKTTMLYLFCRCSVGDGADPALLFGSFSSPENMILRTELSTRLIDDRPLIFANACTTSATDPYVANELEMGFFRRGCRAYIGTESKVPIQLASRFAAIFFNYFYRLVAPEPMAAGEAIAQTRLFLWTQYRNIGGLFYSYVNAYDLFMADDAEIRAMRI